MRVWFFDLLLGHYVPGEDLSVMPFIPGQSNAVEESRTSG